MTVGKGKPPFIYWNNTVKELCFMPFMYTDPGPERFVRNRFFFFNHSANLFIILKFKTYCLIMTIKKNPSKNLKLKNELSLS